MNFINILLIILTQNLFCLSNEAPERVIVLDNKSEQYSVGSFMYIYEDKTNLLSIDDISDPAFDANFNRVTNKIPALGFTNSNYWIRFSIKNVSFQQWEWILELSNSSMDLVELYIPDGLGNYSCVKVGDTFSFLQREINHTDFIFSLILIDPFNPATFYMKLNTQNSMIIPLNLYSSKFFAVKERKQQYFFGIYYGILLVMLFYNFFIYLTLKEKSYLFYVTYIATVFLFYTSINGYGFEFLWSSYPYIQKIFLPFIIGILGINGIRFANNFLMAKKRTPLLYKWNKIIIILGAVLSFSSFVLPSLWLNPISLFYLMVFCISIVVLAFAVIKTGYTLARFFIVAWSIFLLGAILYSLKEFGLIPNNIFSVYTMQIGSGLEVILLAMALAHRINLLRKEKDMAQAEAISNHQLAIENLSKADKLKNEFLANTSHELRTPLHGIIGIVESMIDEGLGVLNNIQKKNLTMVVSSARRLFHLVNGILDFSKLKNSDLELNLKTIDLKQVIEVVTILCTPLIGSKSIKIINNIKEDIPFVYADENRLQQILFNLLGNAIKFTDEGIVTISAIVKNHYIEVTVADTGIGISADKFEDIFKSFEQIDASSSRSYGGTGLGLSITKQLIELHEGTIKVESELKKGSSFIFTLPISAEQEVSGVTEQSITLQSRNEFDPNGVIFTDTILVNKGSLSKIMVVDDEEINLQVIINQLSVVGYDVVIASSGESALEIINSGFKPDIALLDVMMPRMTGFELCKRLRERFNSIELPIIMLTAKNQVSDLIEGLAAGANDYITKPFSKNELLARLKTHLNLAESEKEREKMQKQIFHSSKLASIGTLAAGVAHEINNPLTIIAGCNEMIQDACQNQQYEGLMQLSQQIDSSIVRITNIVKGLKTYSRTDGDDLGIFDLNKIILESKVLVDYIYKKAKVSIQEELNAKNATLFGNIGRFQQVFMNLLSNAKDAMETTGGTITVSTENQENYIILKISDTGCGIPAANLQKIFDTFFTTKPPGKGTGLGLGIVHSIIESMQGSIDVESKEGVGTTFILKFPIKKEEDIVLEKKKVELLKMSQDMNKSNCISGDVLIVEDDESISKLLAKIFSKLGLEVDYASNGQIGLEKVLSKFYDYVVTDINMPKMNGKEMIDKILEQVKYKPKLIVLTGAVLDENSEQDMMIKDLSTIVDDFIFKPFSIKEIREMFIQLSTKSTQERK